ncbi:MAG TPA: hypothetical protein VHN74_12060 [Candidatus Angelobacter sp.]|jgi:hypothetical protein|nr:hypothetical protein [Candidatus Angelobacter sp.]
MSSRIKEIVIKPTIAVVVLALALPLPTSLSAQIRAGGWQHLGSAHVDGRADHDRIQVGGGSFRTLQVGVTGGAIGIERLVVRFRNGGEEVLPVGGVIRSGRRSRDIPLRGGAREIRNVEIWYQKSAANAGKPRVDLFGRN